jgi:acetyl-CoA C-acetyltransferase
VTGVLEPRTPVIVAARRTPIGTAGHALREVAVDRLAAAVLTATHADAGGEPVDDVVLGVARGPGGDVARLAALAAGLGGRTPAVTVDRQCGSGLDAVVHAAALVQSGQADLVLAGGAESASTGPPGRARFTPDGTDDPDMGVAAEQVASEGGVGRARQDAYAARSHARAVAAQAAGRFAAELVPVAGLTADQRPRAGLTPDRLARLRPAFVPGGTVTAGNSCGVSDGAAAVAVVAEEQRRGRPGLRVLASAVAGVDPVRCGLGLVPAVERCLSRAGVSIDEVGVAEINEAFAGQVLACLDLLGLPEDRVCPDGGALALGHPWGASGAVLVVRLFSRLVRQRTVDPQRRFGLAAVSVGGGQGVALLVEPVLA